MVRKNLVMSRQALRVKLESLFSETPISFPELEEVSDPSIANRTSAPVAQVNPLENVFSETTIPFPELEEISEPSIVGRTRSLVAQVNPHLLLALALALAYHGALLFYTFRRTYDAFVHIFFADHYARSWFDPWDYRWYTGFTLTSYPPGSQQTIALLSNVVGLENGFVIAQTFAILMVTFGIYRFSKIWVSEEAAGYAALLTVFSSSITETMHVFGQLPTTFSLGFLLNAIPYVYRWLDEGDWKLLLTAWVMNAATTAGHHVTTLFGAVFFIAPVMLLAIVEKFRDPLPDEPPQRPAKVTGKNFRPLVMRRLRRIMPVTMRCGIYGVGLIISLIVVVLPYWLWSRSDPITQVSIPHASRDSFIENTAAGLVFWLVPYGTSLIALPYAFYKGLTTRAWPMTLSLGGMFFLGTGGTTPFPRMLLRGAYDILTLDRFTFWATITVLPLLGEFVKSLRHGRLARYIREQFGNLTWRGSQSVLIVAYLLASVLIANLTQFRRFQPAPINVQPILNFLEKDQHWRWRYLTLGFGDQMAWLSAQTTATTVDGNYHSARRLPELTTTPVERLEGAKFRGIPGIGSLQQFLAVPDKYNLKFVLANDQFYDPLLYFSGWHRLGALENGIMVWERADIPPLPEVLPRKDIPVYQKAMWGIVPLSVIAMAFIVMTAPWWGPYAKRLFTFLGLFNLLKRLPPLPGLALLSRLWSNIDRLLLRWSDLPPNDDSSLMRWQVWVDWAKRHLSFPKPAAPTAKHVRLALLIAILFLSCAVVVSRYIQVAHDPSTIIQAYYDDLDFRRFGDAYARLDPVTRPEYELYRLQLSATGGLLASFAKLDDMYPTTLLSEPERVVMQIKTVWVTALEEYTTTQRHILTMRDGKWYIQPDEIDVTIPPDQFLRRGTVAWHSQGRRRITIETTSFSDVLDRPELQILSARLVRIETGECEPSKEDEEHEKEKDQEPHCFRYSVVGELINTDADPGDVTVTAFLFDEQGNTLTSYNAQLAIMHKIFPKEVTPFRVDFEGVAGAALNDTETAGEFEPDAYSPIDFSSPVVAFEVYAKAVITSRSLYRDVAVQDLRIEFDDDGQAHVVGQMLNTGTLEATIPHMLITYYDEENRVVWVDHKFIEYGVRPQRLQSFDVPVTPKSEVETLLDKGDLFANILQGEVTYDAVWAERIPLPPEMGYASMRVSLNYFVGNE